MKNTKQKNAANSPKINRKGNTHPTSSGAHKLKKVTLIIGLALILVGAMEVSVVIISDISGSTAHDPYCRSLDFGGGECRVNVTIHNDTNLSYTIKQCAGSNTCKPYADSIILKPGQSTSTIGTTERDPPQPWAVIDQHGRIVGCLNLAYTKEYTNKTVILPLSKLVSCKPYF